MSTNNSIPNITKKKLKQILKENRRFDGRDLNEFRDIVIELGVSKKAEGSARVKLGETEVVAGVKLAVGEPYPDSEDKGNLITSAELLPLSSPRFELGPPKIEAIELARVIDRGLRESGFIDFKKLCIKKGEKVWTIFVDIYSMNDAGNLLDAGFIAATAALKTAKLPKYDEKKERVVFGELTSKDVPVTDPIPVNMTFHKIGESILLDPVREEEGSSEAKLTLAMTMLGKDVAVNSMQKEGEGNFSAEELGSIFDIVEEKSKKIREVIEKQLKKK